MNIFKLVLFFAVFISISSCDRDRERIKARENKLEGSWKFVSMKYKDSKGQSIISTQEPGTPPSIILTLIQADRTGILKVNNASHIFTYIYGGETCEFTFEKKGDLAIEAVGIPPESAGKVFPYKYTFTTSDHNTVLFQSDQEYLKTKDEIINDVQYTFTKL